MQTLDKRKSILHVQNVFLTNPISVLLKRETNKYIIGYEPKTFRVHNLLIKIDKTLINMPQFNMINEIKINTAIDINIREDFRNVIKANDPNWGIKSKNITMRIISTRYNNLDHLYGIWFNFGWRKTMGGGRDYINFSIPECPTIVNSNTINGICYKLINKQISGGGTHALHDYLVLAKEHGNYNIGTWVKITNVNKGGNQHMYTYPVSITL